MDTLRASWPLGCSFISLASCGLLEPLPAARPQLRASGYTTLSENTCFKRSFLVQSGRPKLEHA